MDNLQFINIDNVDENISMEMREKIRRVIAKDALPYVNQIHPCVTAKNTIYTRYIKRAIDILVSLIALIVTIPVNLVLAVGTLLDVGHPIFFRQERVGKDCRLFVITKFRNMTNRTDKNGNLLPPQDRVTKFGRIVRKTSLDELLNFWSIFKGDMSLIGPRPLVPVYTDIMSERHKQRYLVRPGLECPSCNGKFIMSWGEQFENDVWYVENVSFITDCKMIIALVKMVFNRKSRAMRGSAIRGSFVGYYKNGESMNSQQVPEHYVVEARKSAG